MATINTRVVLRNDTKANWEAIKDNRDLALLEGELGIETDTGLFKIGKVKEIVEGNPVLHTWAELEYANEVDLSTVTNKVHFVASDAEKEELATNASVIKVIGDICIVREAANGDAQHYTAHVWSKTGEEEKDGIMVPVYKWCAMGGNYDATNIYFNDDITLAGSYTQVGNITKSANETKILPAAGKNIAEVMQSIFTKEINTDLKNTAPSCSMSGNSTKYYVAGEASEAQTITLSLSKGSYDYGYGYVVSKDEENITAGTAAVTKVTNDGTGVVVDGDKPYTLTWNGKSVTSVTDTTNKFVCESVTKTDAPAQLKCSGTVKYKNAGNPVSNLGNIYPAQAYADATSGANE